MIWNRIDVEGEFDMPWKDVEEKEMLSYNVIDSIPRFITEKTRKKLIKKSPEEVVSLIRAAIERVNAGTKETIETLLRKAL